MSLSFDPDRQSEMIDVLTQAANSLDEILDRLDTEVGAVLSSWDGSAQAAYAYAQTEWLRSVQALKEALRSATGASRSAGDVLAQAERDATHLWS